MHSSPVREATADSDGIPRWVWLALGGGLVLGGAVLYVFWGGQEQGKKKRAAKKNTSVPTPKGSTPSGPVKVEDLAEEEEELVSTVVGAWEGANGEIDSSLSFFQPTDPLQLSLAKKNKGNKYFRGGRYELAVKCYTEAIQGCPDGQQHDLATFHQNRSGVTLKILLSFDDLV